MTKKVLICQPIHESGVKVLDGFDVQVAPKPDEATVIPLLAGVEGVVVRTAPFTRAIMEAAPALKVIARHGVGVDNVDLKAATELGILVTNTPNANALSVAEHALVAIGALAKRVLTMDRGIRKNHWEIRNEYKALDLQGKVLGLVGLGRIGSLLAKKARAAYEMQVVGYDPYLTPERAAELGVRLLGSVEEVLRTADVVSLHTPLTPETRGLVCKERLALLKPTALLVNFSRGEVVVEADLVEALRNGTLAGAALDVFDPEPPTAANPLFELDNVLLSPHSAALTQECVQRMATGAAEAVRDVLSGVSPEFVVNREVKPRAALRPRA
jgi:D-3-phosphoglycerate dehydrogenase